MSEPLAWCNLLVILVTVAVSYAGFRDPEVERKYIFRPESILAGKEYYRLVTSGFLHAGWGHLVCNMVSLYLFGSMLELSMGRADFLLIYFGSVIGGSLLSLYVHRHHDYLAYGASGGVCGVIFAYILLFPGAGVRLYLSRADPWLGLCHWLHDRLFHCDEERQRPHRARCAPGRSHYRPAHRRRPPPAGRLLQLEGLHASCSVSPSCC